MNVRYASRAALLAAALLSATSPAGAQEDPDTDPRPGVAIFPFENGGSHGEGAEAENFEALEVGLQQMLLTELTQNDALRIVERRRLNDLLDEMDLGVSGRVDRASAADVGRVVGARYVVFGTFTDLFGRLRMDARVVDVESSEIIRAEQILDRRENLYEMLVDLAALLVEDMDLPALSMEVREARKAREIPAEAINLYSRALFFEEGGHTERAVELLRHVTRDFPEMVEARQALEQLQPEGG